MAELSRTGNLGVPTSCNAPLTPSRSVEGKGMIMLIMEGDLGVSTSLNAPLGLCEDRKEKLGLNLALLINVVQPK